MDEANSNIRRFAVEALNAEKAKPTLVPAALYVLRAPWGAAVFHGDGEGLWAKMLNLCAINGGKRTSDSAELYTTLHAMQPPPPAP